MKSKNSFYLSFLILLLTFGIVGFKNKDNIFPKKEISYFAKNIGKYCINSLCLVKEENDWILNSNSNKIPANNDIAQIFADKFGDIKLNEVVSNNSDKFEDLGFLNNQKTILEIDNKKLEIGNISSDYEGTYIKEENGNTVYLINIVLDKNKMNDITYWERKNITNISKYQTTKISINWKNINKMYEIKDGKWENEKMVDKLLFLSSVKFLENFKKSNSEEYKYEITTIDQQIYKLSIGKEKMNKKENLYWATIDNKYYFEIAKTDFDLLTEFLN